MKKQPNITRHSFFGGLIIRLKGVLRFFGVNVAKAKRPRKPRAKADFCKDLAKAGVTLGPDLHPYRATDDVKTPYVGYDCDRQTTCDENRVIEPRITSCGKDNVCIGVPQQPNSDNDVKGPTS